MALTTHPHLAPRLKKEHSYIYTFPLVLRGLFYGETYLCLYYRKICVAGKETHSKHRGVDSSWNVMAHGGAREGK